VNRIPLLVPDMPSADELLPYLRRIDAARWYTNFGPLAEELEGELAAALDPRGSVRVCSVANCTLGLELALSAVGLKPGARVLLPALTFVATAMAVRRAGCVPVVCDVDADSWLLTPALARDALARTQVDCVMPVASFGCAQDADDWDEFSAASGCPVVVDAAGAFGNQRVGARGTAVFSLHATKSLGAGEGGFVASADEGVVRRVRQMSNFGIDVHTGEATLRGGNAKLSEYHAAVGLAALGRWRRRRADRVALVTRYAARLAEACPQVVLQRRPAEGVYTIFQVRLPAVADIERIRGQLADAGIETRRWYSPLVCDHPSLASSDVVGSLAVSRSLSTTLLGLPLHLDLTDADCERVCAQLARSLASATR
jgi:dTDP-4-amino-4,6-dideoxygalactose transaminase